MKKLITLITLLTLSSMAFAEVGKVDHQRGKKGKKTIVKGEKAKTIFEALNVEVVTKDRAAFTVDVKKVASLRCVKKIKKSDTAVVKYMCSLKGKKLRGQRGNRPNRDGRRGQRRGNRGGSL